MDPIANFHRAILADPSADVPRLAFADWLDEHEQPHRADFIRAQCAAANPHEPQAVRWARCYHARALLEQHEKTWMQPLGRLLDDWQFKRGLLERISVSANRLVRYRKRLFAAGPITHLHVSELQGRVEVLRSLPVDHGIRTLDLTASDLHANHLLALSDLPNLGSVDDLWLMFNQIDAIGVEVLCHRPFFQRLRRLKCGANPLTDADRLRLEQHFGSRVSFECTRGDDHLYGITHTYWRTITPGVLPDGRQVLTLGLDDSLLAFFFAATGELLETQQREWPPIPENLSPKERDDVHPRFWRKWLKELKLKEQKIWVQRFRFGDRLGILDACFNDVITWTSTDPENPPTRLAANRWHRQGEYAFIFSIDQIVNMNVDMNGETGEWWYHDYWFDRTGEITAT